MSLQALGQKGASTSICEQVSKEIGLEHRYCDPTNEQRAAIGIKGRQDIELEGFFNNWSKKKIAREISTSHLLREKFWLDEMINMDRWPVLFICGADHVDSFCALARKNGFQADVIVRDWADE
jgi:hypothetical protein